MQWQKRPTMLSVLPCAMPGTVAAAALAAVTTLFAASPVVAQEACIICSEPEKVYLCSVEKSDKVQKLGIAEKAVQYVCITEMAKLGGHGTCRVRRDVELGSCSGQPQTVSVASLIDAATDAKRPVPVVPSGAIAGASAASPAPTKAPPGSSPTDAPKTMVELARRTSEQSSEQLKQAGDQVQQAGKQVGGVVQRTWTCMTSLFQRC
jgi:hypothetical protein